MVVMVVVEPVDFWPEMSLLIDCHLLLLQLVMAEQFNTMEETVV